MTDTGPGGVPPITDDMRRTARSQQGGWLYVVDPSFDPDGAVPPEGIVGAYPVDEAGRLGGEFASNPRYQPTPQALRLPEPTDEVDALAQRVATGWAPQSDFVAELARSSLWLMARPASEVFVVDEGAGRRSVWVFTHRSHAERRVPGEELRELTPEEIVEAVPRGVDLVVNPGGAASVRIPFPAFESVARPGR